MGWFSNNGRRRVAPACAPFGMSRNKRQNLHARGKWCEPSQRGIAVVEFALILPVLLVLLMGMVDMSLALYDKTVITNASREAARAGIVARNPSFTDSEIRQLVQTYTQGSLLTMGPGQVLPTVQVERRTLNTGTESLPTLKVSVSYTFQGIGLGELLKNLGQPLVLKASTEMVYE